MAKRGENIYKRKDGRYEGRYIKGRNINGKPKFGYVYGYTYSEVKDALTLAKAAVNRNTQICVIGKGSLSEFLYYWLKKVLCNHIKPSTYARYHERIQIHIVPALGHTPVCRLTQEQTQEFVYQLSRKGLSSTTVRSIAGLLNSAMKKAAELRLTHDNPCSHLILPQTSKAERRALDRSEQVRLERLVSQSDSGTMLGVLLALYTGLRIGEICALRWRDIDLCGGTLTVRGTLQRMKNFQESGPKTLLAEGTPKSKGSLRKIPLPPGLTDKLRCFGNNMPGECYVLSDSEAPVEPHTFRSRFKRLSAKAGLDIPFHSLRHTFATRCLEHNFDIQSLSEFLGHATSGVTMKVYAHSVFEHKQRLINRVNILSEIGEPSNKPSDNTGARQKVL